MIICGLQKDEKGTYTGTVRVRGKSGTYDRKQRLGRKDTGKIASLPQGMKDEILSLRKLGYSGAKLKSTLETMIESKDDDKLKQDLYSKGLIKSAEGEVKLNITGQALVEWSAKRGVTSPKTRKKSEDMDERYNQLKTVHDQAVKEVGSLKTELKNTEDQMKAYRLSSHNALEAKDAIRLKYLKVQDENEKLKAEIAELKK